MGGFSPGSGLSAETALEVLEQGPRVERNDPDHTGRPVPEQGRRDAAVLREKEGRRAGGLVVEEEDGVDPAIPREFFERVLGRVRAQDLERRRGVELAPASGLDGEHAEHASNYGTAC